MAKILRIVFTILCAICIALVIPVGALWDWMPAIGIGIVALLFFGLMLLCKQAQEAKEANGKGEKAVIHGIYPDFRGAEVSFPVVGESCSFPCEPIITGGNPIVNGNFPLKHGVFLDKRDFIVYNRKVFKGDDEEEYVRYQIFRELPQGERQY